MQQSSQQRNIFNLYPNSSRNYNHIPNMMYSKTSSSRIRRHRIPHQKHHQPQPHNQIITTIYDPKEHRYLDPYEIDNNNLLINRLLKSSRSRTIPTSTQQSSASLDLINDNQYLPNIFQSEAYHHGTNTIQMRDAMDTSRAAIDYFLNNRKARATPNHHNNKSATSIQRFQGHHFCPGQDVATRAYLAPIVFEGKVRSMSSNKKPHYAVTFEVKIVYKNQSKFNKPLVKNETIRLHFAHGKGTTCECLDYYSNNNISSTKLSSSTINNNSHHQMLMQHQISSSSATQQHVHCGNLVKAHLRAGKTYILFVNRLGAHNYTVLGPPVASTNKSVHAVLRVVHNLNSVKPANVSELNDVTLKWGKKLKLVCRTQGFPPPRVHWLKNGTDNFLRLKRVRIQHRRRQSTLVISKVKLEDAGRYECSARGVIGPPITKSAFVRVLNNTRTENTSSADPHPCTEDRAQICMNGGTCMFFSTIGEYACQCANGFNGRRCDQKMPLMTKSTYTSYSCNDKYLC
ncbi:protein vein isoform X2 [Chrysoperla carnea]|uniref:protein vein isoform X2 n=1 Tax=Chrysoperla carnea TaxID=189513 RepID=UPI001D0734C1|nr:protein vein isoform X2 [Chrysoperla carnea]